MKKILVIDGNSIINRAFFGVRPLTTKSGKNTNAIYGMVNIIHKQIEAIKPDYAAVAFDLKAPTFRHKMFDGYKAGRNPTPPELLEQFDDAKECMRLMGIHTLELEGYEADDIQGTVAAFAHEAEDTESYILSGDRDLLQLIDEKITVLLAGNSETKAFHEAEFREKYGISPSEFVDMKALMGDSSDNIPGVRGIGEKTAASLISQFSTLEGIYENIDSPAITKSVRAKLIDGRDNAFLSRTLAKIETKAPIKETLGDLTYGGLNRGGLYKKFTELELNSFITKFKLSKSDCKTAESKEISDNCKEELENTSCNEAIGTKRTTPTVATADDIASITAKRIALVRTSSGYNIYDGKNNFVFDGDISAIRSLCLRSSEIITNNAKELIHSLSIEGCGGIRFLDLTIYAYVLNPGSGESTLPSLFSMFLSETVGDNEPIADILPALEEKMRKKIENEDMLRVLDELEIPLIPILADIERCGFKINCDGMLEFADALDELAKELQERIYVQALGEFNINSPKQLGEVLYVKLGLPHKAKKNKNGFSTDAETLEELRQYSPIIDDILEYRQVTKLRGTYAAQLPKVADGEERIHTVFNQALTTTGRLSSQDPNLQNIPIRTKMGREMRRYFISRDGYSLVDADYSQIELRLLAHISDDYNMSEAFRCGEDIHKKTAAAVFGVPEEAVNDEMRKRAKAVNFGIVYGISGFSLAKDIGTTTQEASKYIKNYLLNYPFIDVYLTRVVEEAKETGYTATIMGRRRYIPELNASNGILRAFGKRVAMNAPIQGTAADVMKLAMIKVYERLKADEPDSKIVMQVHDELIIEAPDERVEAVKRIVKEEMENAVSLNVPLTVDVTSGKNWLEQK